jgi:hypothetical protein
MNGKEYFARSMTKVVEATHEAESIACDGEISCSSMNSNEIRLPRGRRQIDEPDQTQLQYKSRKLWSLPAAIQELISRIRYYYDLK